MAIIHRKIGGFEYDYEEVKCKDTYDHGVIIESVKHIVVITRTPRVGGGYKNNEELLEFIVALERSGELDKVETKYTNIDYGELPKPWEQLPTITFNSGENIILGNNSEHDAKTRTCSYESSDEGVRYGPKDLSA